MYGTLQEGACYRDAVANVLAPNVESVGFGCYGDGDSAHVRPTDNRLLYIDSQDEKLYAFTADLHEYDADNEQCIYPTAPQDNDVILPTPACDSNFGPARFVVGPDDGAVWYTCFNTNNWYDENDALIPWSPNNTPLARAAGGIALANQNNLKTFGLGAPPLADGGMAMGDDGGLAPDPGTPLTGLPASYSYVASRSNAEGGFDLVVRDTTGLEDVYARYGVQPYGVASLKNTYGPLPADANVNFYGAGKLDATGAFYVEGSDTTETFVDVIIRLNTDGSSEVVYTEADDPEVKLHISYLFTGP
jgi:hypothetical protein